MPTGQHHDTPPGLWYQQPNTQSYPKLFLGTARTVAIFVTGLGLLIGYRSLAYKYTYTDFIGKTMTYGKLTTYTHEPLSVAEIDKLKEEQAARKMMSRI